MNGCFSRNEARVDGLPRSLDAETRRPLQSPATGGVSTAWTRVLSGCRGAVIEHDHLPVAKRRKDELHIAPAVVAAAGEGERVIATSIGIGRSPAGSHELVIGSDADFEAGEQWRRSAISMHVALMRVLGSFQIDEMHDGSFAFTASDGSDDFGAVVWALRHFW